MSLQENYKRIKEELEPHKVTLVVVSKTRPVDSIKALYDLGQRDFGENRVQELESKVNLLPSDIKWHLIGHLQSNKVKYIIDYVHLIHSVDSLKLLQTIDDQAKKAGRKVDVLLQVHIAEEEAKFGFSPDEVLDIDLGKLVNSQVVGLMGMATNTDNLEIVEKEFKNLKNLYDTMQAKYPTFTTLSMGMSGDYLSALEHGSNMLRLGSVLFK